MNREEMSSGDLKIYKKKNEILKLYSIFGKWLHMVGIDPTYKWGKAKGENEILKSGGNIIYYLCFSYVMS